MISRVGSPLGTFDIPIANSAGHSAHENPIDGTAARTGIVGAHAYAGDHVEGDADLTVSFFATEMDVGFTGMMSASGTSYAAMSWRNLAMENGGFASGGLQEPHRRPLLRPEPRKSRWRFRACRHGRRYPHDPRRAVNAAR